MISKPYPRFRGRAPQPGVPVQLVYSTHSSATTVRDIRGSKGDLLVFYLIARIYNQLIGCKGCILGLTN